VRTPSALVPVVAGFGVILLLLLAVTAIGVTHIRHLSNQLTAIVSERNQKAEFAATMHALHQARYQSLILASSLDDPFLRDEEMMRFASMAGTFIQVRDRFLDLPLDADELELWHEIRGELLRVEEHAGQIFDLLGRDAVDAARGKIRHELLPRQKRMMQGWSRLLDMQREKNQAAQRDALAARDRAQTLAMALSAAAMLVGVGIAVFVVRLSRRLEKDLFEEKERAQVTLQAIADGVVRFDKGLDTGYLNPAAEQLLGLSAREAMGRPLGDVLRLFDRQTRGDLTAALTGDIRKGAPLNLPGNASLLSAQGMEFEVEGRCSPIHDQEGRITGGVLVIRDVTEERELNRKLSWQADHDSLTGLHNRRAFEERVARALGGKRAGDMPMSLLFIDLDYFKQVNDSAGHAAGDELLRQLAGLMLSRIRDSDLLARLGGDEFGVMLTACPHDVAERIALAIRDGIANWHFTWEDRGHRVGASIGVVHVPPTWASLDECLAAADAACYKAKQNGRNAIVVHQDRAGD
jgi:diguanylate cyclase (GGDEF)-like protein/PAS domain S-box-containing protein